MPWRPRPQPCGWPASAMSSPPRRLCWRRRAPKSSGHARPCSARDSYLVKPTARCAARRSAKRSKLCRPTERSELADAESRVSSLHARVTASVSSLHEAEAHTRDLPRRDSKGPRSPHPLGAGGAAPRRSGRRRWPPRRDRPSRAAPDPASHPRLSSWSDTGAIEGGAPPINRTRRGGSCPADPRSPRSRVRAWSGAWRRTSPSRRR